MAGKSLHRAVTGFQLIEQSLVLTLGVAWYLYNLGPVCESDWYRSSLSRKAKRDEQFNEQCSTHFKCSMNCSLRLAALAKRDEHFHEHFAMKRRQRRSKQIKYESCTTLLDL